MGGFRKRHRRNRVKPQTRLLRFAAACWVTRRRRRRGGYRWREGSFWPSLVRRGTHLPRRLGRAENRKVLEGLLGGDGSPERLNSAFAWVGKPSLPRSHSWRDRSARDHCRRWNDELVGTFGWSYLTKICANLSKEVTPERRLRRNESASSNEDSIRILLLAIHNFTMDHFQRRGSQVP